jgi:homoserine dehydrogenase
MKEIRLALLGFGNAGQAFAELLIQKEEELAGTLGARVLVVAIATKSKGTLMEGKGIPLKKILEEIREYGRFSDSINMTAMEIAENAEYDVLVELTPLDIFSGEPAIQHIKAAIFRRKHAITANKGPVAWAYRELKDLAMEKGVDFFCETTVMDGTPIFNLVEETLPFCKVTRIDGILNTTTNFVLEEMAKGVPYDQVIAEGKRRGFVEADPTTDIEGWDAAAKVAALMNVLMDAGMTPLEVDRKGIEDVTLEQIQEAAGRGKVIKLLCRGELLDGKPVGSVRPVETDRGDLLATIDGTSSVVSITTDLMGTISIVEHNPEIEQTAFGIFSDMIRVIRNLRQNG